jgi:hypothetical protein
MESKISNHLLLWFFCALILTGIYSIGLPSFYVAAIVILLLLPVHIIYYYSVTIWLIPQNLNKKKCSVLIFGILACCIFCTLLFRIMEITIVDPYILKEMQAQSPDFKWKKLNGTFIEQLINPLYLINALEQSNTVIWIAISIKYFKIWFERRQVVLQSEVDFLKAKLNPHFLFNTLNNLYALTLIKSPESPKIVLGLSSILRYMLNECHHSSVLLKRDIEILNSYIELEKIRYDDRLDLSFSINGEILEQRIPPLLMFPLVESAFKEGISETIEDPWININLEIKGCNIKFKVSHSLPKFKPLNQTDTFELNGLKNLHKKLEAQFSGGYELKMHEGEEMSIAIMQLDLTKQY